MSIAAIILSVIALIISVVNLSLMLAKNFFSSHTVQYVDPFEKTMPQEIGKKIFDQFQDLDIPMDQEEIDELKGKKAKF